MLGMRENKLAKNINKELMGQQYVEMATINLSISEESMELEGSKKYLDDIYDGGNKIGE
jgi:hypothetical protein